MLNTNTASHTSIHRRPVLTPTDILRIVRREYPKYEDEVRTLLNRIDVPEKIRVQAAVLKLGEGELIKFRSYAYMAMSDFNSVLVFAEFPNFFHIENNSVEKREQSINRDLLAYIRWIHR